MAMGALVAALVGGIRARVGEKRVDGVLVQRLDGWGVIALAAVCTALVYAGARWLPEDVQAIVGAFVIAVGGTATAKQIGQGVFGGPVILETLEAEGVRDVKAPDGGGS